MRSTAQRLGDVTLVLTLVASLTLVARAWAATDVAHGHADVFWSYLGATAAPSLTPAFAAACTSSWMDEPRRRFARTALVAVLALVALWVLGDALFGSHFAGGGRGASLMQDAASLLMVAGGFSLVGGLVPNRDER